MRISDWSSDVCSSDLRRGGAPDAVAVPAYLVIMAVAALPFDARLDMVGAVEQEGERHLEHLGDLGLVRREHQIGRHDADDRRHLEPGDRKSTRLNSSH